MKPMYLIQLCHTMDDLPLFLTDDEKKARAFGRRVRPDPTEAMRRVFSTDCSTPVCVEMTTFDTTGKPVTCQTLKTFD